MKIEIPGYISNNTRLVLYVMRQTVPANRPFRLIEMIRKMLDVTKGMGIDGIEVTENVIKCAISNQARKENGEYKKVGTGIYVRVDNVETPVTAQKPKQEAMPKPEFLLNQALKSLKDNYKINPLNMDYEWEELTKARNIIRGIINHIETAKDLLTTFPYEDMLINKDENNAREIEK